MVTVVHAVDPAAREETVPAGTPASEAGDALVREGVEDAEDRGSECSRMLRTAGASARGRRGVRRRARPRGRQRAAVRRTGRGGRYEELLGSTAKRLFERTPVPVTVVSRDE
jgi:nucleotide-binding universal stress UspA family protein